MPCLLLPTATYDYTAAAAVRFPLEPSRSLEVHVHDSMKRLLLELLLQCVVRAALQAPNMVATLPFMPASPPPFDCTMTQPHDIADDCLRYHHYCYRSHLSASVLLPWSIWATMEKFLIRDTSVSRSSPFFAAFAIIRRCSGRPPPPWPPPIVLEPGKDDKDAGTRARQPPGATAPPAWHCNKKEDAGRTAMVAAAATKPHVLTIDKERDPRASRIGRRQPIPSSLPCGIAVLRLRPAMRWCTLPHTRAWWRD